MSIRVNERDSGFVNGRGQKIYCRSWPAQLKSRPKPRGVVLILHGFAEHCGLYKHVARVLSKHELAVTAHDHVGFGRSEGDRAHVSDFNHYVDDVIQHIDLIEERYPNLPFFIIGHSMGALVGLRASIVLRHKLRGLVLLAPLIVRCEPEEGMVANFLLQVTAWFCPQFIVTPKLDSAQFGTNKEMIQKYEEDPLVYHQGMRAKYVVEIKAAVVHMREHVNEVTCPLMIIHGDADQFCDVRGSQLLHSQSGSRDKTINIYKGVLHQVHNEPGNVGQRCLTSMVDWIIGRT